MAMYVYVKAPPKVKRVTVKTRKPAPLPGLSLNQKRLAKISSFIFTGIGVVLIAVVALPLLYYQFIFDPGLTEQKILSPVPVVQAQESGSVLGADSDYSNANTWFPTAVPQTKVVSAVSSYTLSIPDLHILDATVMIASDDLNKSLIHYGGTALPGDYGNSVVFGHSVLPLFFDPHNYMTIFSTLSTLKNNAKIIINYDGITYTYAVYSREVVDPSDVSALSQRYDDSYLTLITCHPPGTYLKRLVVKARLLRPQPT